MEIKCQYCDHIGRPAAMHPKGNTIELICSACGQVNRIEGESEIVKKESKHIVQFESLLPEKGVGPRCPKCFTLLDEALENCKACGLDLQKDYSAMPNLPWEKSPKGKEAEYDQALLLWNTLEEDPTETGFEKFVKFTNALGFHDLQIRKLRGFLVHSPDHKEALKYLKKQSSLIQTRLIVAQTQSQGRTQELGSQMQNVKQRLLLGVALGLFILILAFANFLYA